MSDLSNGLLIATFAIFVWSGFIRSALGFGGAALSLPLFLLVFDSPVVIIPIIAIHMLVFGTATIGLNYSNVDWKYLAKSFVVIIPFKIMGVIGLLNLPDVFLNFIVYFVTSIYAFGYIFDYKPKINIPYIDNILLAIGGYISGTSLIGAPMIIAVFSKYVNKTQLRETLFMLWIVLVSIKLIGFIITDTAINFDWAIYTLPFVFIGHFLGLKVHKKIMFLDQTQFLRSIGIVLLMVCILGAFSQF